MVAIRVIHAPPIRMYRLLKREFMVDSREFIRFSMDAIRPSIDPIRFSMESKRAVDLLVSAFETADALFVCSHAERSLGVLVHCTLPVAVL